MGNDHPDALKEILLFCLGSTSYRTSRKATLSKALRVLPTELLVDSLQGAHLVGLFRSAVDGLSIDMPEVRAFRRATDARQRVRSLFNQHLYAELVHLGERLAVEAPHAQPIILKGISYWHTLYADPLERQVRDLDLLVRASFDAEAVCDVLDSEGYEGLFFVDDARTVRSHLLAGDCYSAPPYRLRRRIDWIDERHEQLRADVHDHGATVGLEFIAQDEIAMTIDVELHTSLFVTEIGTRPACDRQDVRPSPTLPPFGELAPGAALAYAAAKFSIDAIEAVLSGANGLKCLKLMADFVLLLRRCSQSDYDDAFRTAREWGCLHHLLDTLQAARHLSPELALHDVPPACGMNSLDMRLEAATADDKAEAICSV